MADTVAYRLSKTAAILSATSPQVADRMADRTAFGRDGGGR
jgi:hypothetical protein